MKKKILASIIIAVLIASMSMLSVFAATETMDISPETLREVNGASDADDATTMQGPTWSGVGGWHNDDGTTWLEPFVLWSHAGNVSGTIVMMNYGNYIKISNDIDLSKYSKATISLSAGAALSEEYEIGFFSKAIPFGQAGAKNTDGLIASGAVPVGDAVWDSYRTMEIDLSNVDYKGELFISYYMAGTDGCCVTEIELTLKDGQTSTDPTTKPTAKPTDPTKTPDKKPDNSKTGDSSMIFAVAAAGIVLTVLLKKKITA